MRNARCYLPPWRDRRRLRRTPSAAVNGRCWLWHCGSRWSWWIIVDHRLPKLGSDLVWQGQSWRLQALHTWKKMRSFQLENMLCKSQMLQVQVHMDQHEASRAIQILSKPWQSWSLTLSMQSLSIWISMVDFRGRNFAKHIYVHWLLCLDNSPVLLSWRCGSFMKFLQNLQPATGPFAKHLFFFRFVRIALGGCGYWQRSVYNWRCWRSTDAEYNSE